MDIALLRSRLAECLGEPRYRKFVEQVVRFARHQGRLRYWQQDEWGAFVAKYPEYAIDHQSICDAFNLCHLHFCEFKQMEVPVLQGCVDFSREFERDMIQSFPFAKRDFFSTEGMLITDTHVRIMYCEECEQAMQSSRWRKKANRL